MKFDFTDITYLDVIILANVPAVGDVATYITTLNKYCNVNLFFEKVDSDELNKAIDEAVENFVNPKVPEIFDEVDIDE